MAKLRYTKFTGGFQRTYEVWAEGETRGLPLGIVERGPAGMWVAKAKGKGYYGATREQAASQLPGAKN